VNLTVDQASDRFEGLADKASIVDFADWIEAWATGRALGETVAFAMRLCVEEAVTNIALYAYDGAPGPVRLDVVSSGDDVTVTISDHGAPFDVSTARDPGTEVDIETATIGGRGIRLMRQFSDRLAYGRVGDQNRLSLTFLTRRPAPSR
jgi:anti-sigma regulatory factor (Ser/Thr protein kinase)